MPMVTRVRKAPAVEEPEQEAEEVVQAPKRAVRTPRRASAQAAEAPAEEETLFLPEEVSVPSDDLGDYTILIYGEKKIGKTSLCSNFPEALFFMFEPGGHGLSIFQVEITGWVAFKKYIRLLEENPERFKTCVIDTIDNAYEMCFNYVCKKNGIDHPNEERDYGQSWKKIDDEFKATMARLFRTSRGIIFTSHAIEREFQERTGKTYSKIIPSMANQARKFIIGTVDIILYYGYYGRERLMTVAGSDSVEAGQRVKNHFFTTEGERVHSIPCGNDEEAAYRNLLRAFGNRLRHTYEPDAEAQLSEKKVGIKKPGARRALPTAAD